MLKRRLIFCFLMLACYLKSSAQFSAGTLWLGGNINYGSTIDKVNGIAEPQAKTVDYSIQPYFGKSIDEKSVLGISILFRTSKDKYTGPAGRTTSDYVYGGGVFYRRYKALGKNFYLYADGELNYAYEKTSFVSGVDIADFKKSKIDHISLIAYPGLSYALKKNILLEVRTGDLITISYRGEKNHIEWPINNKRDERVRYFSVSSNFNDIFNNFGVGFRFLLGGEITVDK